MDSCPNLRCCVQTLLFFLASNVAVAGETALLQFSSPHCGPCRQMKPVVAQLAAAGYPVQHVDVTSQRNMARRFAVSGVPCFVALVDGQEAGRMVGATSYSQLEQLCRRVGIRPEREARNSAADTRRGRRRRSSTRVSDNKDQTQRSSSSGPTSLARADSPAQSAHQISPDSQAKQIPEKVVQRAMAASVRLKVSDPQGHSWGSGTIIDSLEDQALVLTCGHIFRESKGRGQVLVDLMGPGGPQGLQGRVLGYDLHSDVGLVVVSAPRRLPVIPVASSTYRLRVGQPVVSIGCGFGGPAKAEPSRITSINKFQGPDNIQVAGLPVQGRSGGGLFSAEGFVIGICNAADPQDREGLYAALSSIHRALAAADLSSVIRQPSPASQPSPSQPPQSQPKVVQLAGGQSEKPRAEVSDSSQQPAEKSQTNPGWTQGMLSNLSLALEPHPDQQMPRGRPSQGQIPQRMPGQGSHPSGFRPGSTKDAGGFALIEGKQFGDGARLQAPRSSQLLPVAKPGPVIRPRPPAGRDPAKITRASGSSGTTTVVPTSSLTVQENATIAGLMAAGGQAEVVCVIRSLAHPQARSEIIVLDRASPEFLELLTSERQVQQSQKLTDYRAVQVQRASFEEVRPPRLPANRARANRARANRDQANRAWANRGQPDWEPNWLSPLAPGSASPD